LLSVYGRPIKIENLVVGKDLYEKGISFIAYSCVFKEREFVIIVNINDQEKISDFFVVNPVNNYSNIEKIAKRFVNALNSNDIYNVSTALDQMNSKLTLSAIRNEWTSKTRLLGSLKNVEFTTRTINVNHIDQRKVLVVMNCPFELDTIPISIIFNADYQMIDFYLFKPDWIEVKEKYLEEDDQDKGNSANIKKKVDLKRDFKYYKDSFKQVEADIKIAISKLQRVRISSSTSRANYRNTHTFISRTATINYYIADDFYDIVDSGRESLYGKFKEDKYAGLRAYIFKYYPAKDLFSSIRLKDYKQRLVEETTILQYEAYLRQFIRVLNPTSPTVTDKPCKSYKTYSEPEKEVFVRLVPAYEIPGWPTSNNYQPDSTYTDNLIENVWLGYYTCVATKIGYKDAKADFDLAQNPGTKIVCTLIPIEKNGESWCRLQGDK